MGCTFFANQALEYAKSFFRDPAKDNKEVFSANFEFKSKVDLKEALKLVTVMSKEQFNAIFERYLQTAAWGRQLTPTTFWMESPTDVLKKDINKFNDDVRNYNTIAGLVVNYMLCNMNHGYGFCVFLAKNISTIQNGSLILQSEVASLPNNAR